MLIYFQIGRDDETAEKGAHKTFYLVSSIILGVSLGLICGLLVFDHSPVFWIGTGAVCGLIMGLVLQGRSENHA